MTTTFYSSSTGNNNSLFVSQARTHSSHSFYCPSSQLEPDPELDRGTYGLELCTEGLGFESSNMMVGSNEDTNCCDCCSTDWITHGDYNHGRKMGDSDKTCMQLSEKRDFPPPLSSLREHGRPSFVLKSVRNNGRLEINRVPINRPGTLLASRQNGRLRLHLVEDLDREDDETGDESHMEGEETTEERGNYNEAEETAAEVAVVADDEEEREWKIPTVRRCYQREVIYPWGQQQNRCVTTMHVM